MTKNKTLAEKVLIKYNQSGFAKLGMSLTDYCYNLKNRAEKEKKYILANNLLTVYNYYCE